ncbi:MAG: thioredoxin [Fusobacteria bacterium]|nr:thioredoxin [Fusobacteriota bacterium]
MSVKHITEAEFVAEISSGKVTLVDFYADWCGPCKMLGPILEQISGEMPNVNIIKVNVDNDQNLAMQFNVRSIPTMVLFKDGKPVETMIGLLSKPALVQKLSALV